MRVLLSAYACEPNKGSEQEVGWRRALSMTAFADETWVITRANNQTVIESDSMSRTTGLRFIYYDLPGWVRRLKRRSLFLYPYFVLWQWGAYRAAAKQHRLTPFDMVYHVTFVSMLAGSFMGRLGIPFIVGPIGGGERAPFRLRRGMPWRGILSELRRDLGIALQRHSPIATPAFAAADRIFVTSPQSLELIPKKWLGKTVVAFGIAIDGSASSPEERPRAAGHRFVFMGRLLHWKGAHLAIGALAEVRRTVPDASLTLFGSGSGRRWLESVARRLGVQGAVTFAGHLPRDEVLDSLHDYAALVFPSLHDSGGMAVLEALSRGLPVVCVGLGGPGVIVDDTCGVAVPVGGSDEQKVIRDLARGMTSIVTMAPSEYRRLSAGARARAQQFSWTALTERIISVERNRAPGMDAFDQKRGVESSSGIEASRQG